MTSGWPDDLRVDQIGQVVGIVLEQISFKITTVQGHAGVKGSEHCRNGGRCGATYSRVGRDSFIFTISN